MVLNAMLSQVEFRSDCSESKLHRRIYSYIDKDISHTEQYQNQCPPFQVLCYAIKNITHPDIVHSQIRDLSDLLSNVESHRRTAYDLAKNLNVIQLEDSATDQHRSIFRHIIFDLCELDVYQLWISENSHLLPLRLTEYFPNLKLPDGLSTTPPPYFHLTLSQNEKSDLRLVEQRCAEFLKRVNTWETKRDDHLTTRGLSHLMYEESEFFSYQRDFRDAFPCPIDSRTLIRQIDQYLHHVQQTVDSLQRIHLDDATVMD